MSRLAALGGVALLALAGCAEPGDAPGRARAAGHAPPEPRPDWSTQLPGLLPAIEACLDASGQPAVGVTKAWPIPEGLAGVRVLEPGGERLDCVAGTEEGDVLLTEKVWNLSQLPGEREPLFTPRSQSAPPGSACIAVSVARDATGGQVGWLSYDVCRHPRPAGPSAENALQPRLPGPEGNG